MLQAREEDFDDVALDKEDSPNSVTQLRRLASSHLKIDTAYKMKSEGDCSEESPTSELSTPAKRRKSVGKIAARLGISVDEATSIRVSKRHECGQEESKMGPTSQKRRRGSVEKIQQMLGVDLVSAGGEEVSHWSSADEEMSRILGVSSLVFGTGGSAKSRRK